MPTCWPARAHPLDHARIGLPPAAWLGTGKTIVILKSMGLVSGVNVLKAAVTFMTTVVLAGKIDPAAFGLVSFAVPLMAFLTLLTDLGLASAIVRHPSLDRREAGAAVAFLGLAGAAAGVLLALTAGLVEQATRLSGLTGVLYGFAMVTAASIWGVAPRALLERRLAYKAIAAIEGLAVAAALVTFGTGVVRGYGIYSLVGFHVVMQAIRALAFTMATHADFDVKLKFGLVRPLLNVGGWVFGSNLFGFAARNADRFLIGTVLGSASLGIYGLAYQFMTVPLMLMSWPISGVLLAVLSRLPSDSEQRQKIIGATITLSATVSFPVMAFLAFATPFPILSLYGQRWNGLADAIALLAPVGAIQSIAAYGGAVLTAKGQVRRNFIVNSVGASLIILGFAASTTFGLVSVLVTYLITATIASVWLLRAMCNAEQVRLPTFLGWLKPGVVAAAPGLVAASFVHLSDPVSFQLWLSMVLAFVVFGLIAMLCFRSRLESAVRSLTAIKSGRPPSA